jgi:hypothetical protein
MNFHADKRRVEIGIDKFCLGRYVYIDIWEHESLIPPQLTSPSISLFQEHILQLSEKQIEATRRETEQLFYSMSGAGLFFKRTDIDI